MRYFTRNGVSLKPREKREYIKACPDNWDKMLYSAKHYLIKKMYGNPKRCEMCNRTQKTYTKSTNETTFEWANIDHNYKIERKYWKKVCRQCHAILDKKITDRFNRL